MADHFVDANKKAEQQIGAILDALDKSKTCSTEAERETFYLNLGRLCGIVMMMEQQRDAALAVVAQLGRAIEESVCGTPRKPSMGEWLALLARAKDLYGGDFPALPEREASNARE